MKSCLVYFYLSRFLFVVVVFLKEMLSLILNSHKQECIVFLNCKCDIDLVKFNKESILRELHLKHSIVFSVLPTKIVPNKAETEHFCV